LVPRHKFKKLQSVLHRGRRPEPDLFTQHREFRSRKPRPEILKSFHQVARSCLRRLHRATRRAIHCARMAKIIAHQLRRIPAQRFLHVEAQQVLIPPGRFMHPHPQPGVKFERGAQVRSRHSRRQRCQPTDRLQIAQPAGTFFQIRFQVKDRVAKFRAPPFAQQHQPVRNRRAALGQERLKSFVHPARHRRIAGKQAPVEQADGQLRIFLAIRGAIIHRVDRMAGTQPRVPQALQESRYRRFHRSDLRLRFDNEHQIDIRMRKQFAAPEASAG
jgi:hypothetical protein